MLGAVLTRATEYQALFRERYKRLVSAAKAKSPSLGEVGRLDALATTVVDEPTEAAVEFPELSVVAKPTVPSDCLFITAFDAPVPKWISDAIIFLKAPLPSLNSASPFVSFEIARPPISTVEAAKYPSLNLAEELPKEKVSFPEGRTLPVILPSARSLALLILYLLLCALES